MKQLGRFQKIPPPDPHHWTELKRLNKIVHAARQGDDWSTKHQDYIRLWDDADIVEEARPYDPSQYHAYRQWFQKFGMYTVYIRGQIEAGLDRPLQPPHDSVEVMGYVPGGSHLRRVVYLQN
jgi:hypothetical protein